MTPRSTRLERVLLVDGRDGQRGRLGCSRVVHLDLPLGLAVPDGELFGPLAFDRVQHVFLFAFRVQSRREGVLLPAKPAFARVVDPGRVARRALDVRAFVEFDER